MELSPEQLEAIASLWKLVATLTVLLGLIFFRGPIGNALDRFTRLRVKRGETEVVVGGDKTTPDAPTLDALAVAPPEEPKTEQPQVRLPAAQEPGQWFGKMVDGFLSGKLKEAEDDYKNLLQSETEPLLRLRSEAVYLSLRYRYGNDDDALKTLGSLADKQEIQSLALSLIGQCYEHSSVMSHLYCRNGSG